MLKKLIKRKCFCLLQILGSFNEYQNLKGVPEEWSKSLKNKTKGSQALFNNEILCPTGSVPILRHDIDKVNIARAEVLKKIQRSLYRVNKNDDSTGDQISDGDNDGDQISDEVEYAGVRISPEHGIRKIEVKVNVWHPTTEVNDEYTRSEVQLVAGSGSELNVVGVGWLVKDDWEVPKLFGFSTDDKMNWTAGDAVDYKGSPADRSKTGGWVPASLILGIEICERLSTMGIAVNLVTYLGGTMHLPSSKSANIVTDFLGTTFLLCLLGGFLADSYIGRFKTIVIFAVIQTLGTGMLAMATKLPELRPPPCQGTLCKKANEFQMGILYLSLYLIALGTGGLKSSVSGFGTDQFDEGDESEKAQMAYFFNRFFFFISLGTLTAVTLLVYVQDEVGRSLGYGICSVSMVIAILIFLSGIKRYRYKKTSGSPVVHILQVIVASIRKRKMAGALYEDSPEISRIHHTNQFRCLDKAAVIMEGEFEKSEDGSSFTYNPWKLSSVTRVEEVKMVIRVLPIWATTIMFWTTYAQMITFSVQQASTMKRSIGNFLIPAGSLTVFFVAAILITLALYDRLIMPLYKKWKGTPGFSNLERIAIGLLLSVIGMAAAALAERKRLSVAKETTSTATLPVSVFILVPQFFLVGSGEAFIYTGQLDFFITQSPKGMKTMSTAIFLTTLSLGFFFSSFLVSIVKRATGRHGEQGWLADNINHARLDYFYALLAILSVGNLVLYLVCAAWYKKQMPKSEILQKKNLGAEDKC